MRFPAGADMILGRENRQTMAGLKKGEVVAVKAVLKAVRDDFDKHSGCVAGALRVRKLKLVLHATGFHHVRVTVKEASKEFIKDWFPASGIEGYVRSADVQGFKPEESGAR